MSNHIRKVSEKKQKELVEHYLAQGMNASKIECSKLGLSPRYAASVAAAWGWHSPKHYRGGGKIALTVDHSDPRWAWAKERGAISWP